MSQSPPVKSAEDRSTSKSADSHTISAPNELSTAILDNTNVSHVKEYTGQQGLTSLASEIIVKSEPLAANAHSLGPSLPQSSASVPQSNALTGLNHTGITSYRNHTCIRS